ncbi:MAG: threonine-phosphate decarboxylase CobD [Lachnospiraceae bacterium]
MLENQHGGDIYRNLIRYDFSININPFGMPEGVQEVLRNSVNTWNCYPDPDCQELVQALAAYHHIPEAAVCCGNGAADLIYRLVQLVRPSQALVLAPTFSEYEQALIQAGCHVNYCTLKQEQGFVINWEELISQLSPELDLLFFCNPNNPTGIAAEKEQLQALAAACRQHHIFLVLDECFCDFLDEPERYSMLTDTARYPGMMIIKAFTKTYAMAGLRLGYAVCADHDLIKRLRQAGQPWSVSVPAQLAGTAALKETGYVARSAELISAQRKHLICALQELGFQVYDSQANYIFFRDKPGGICGNLWETLKAQQILIRDCSNYHGLEAGYYRIAVKTAEENRGLLEALKEIQRMEGTSYQCGRYY